MINLRKLSAIVLSAALVLTSMTTVFAADAATIANADKAATLKDLSLYAGQDANDPKVGLENALTTQDSLIFLAKLFGYNEDANALLADQVADALAKFDDAASISDYAKNVVAYSAANGILSGSTKDGKFFVGAKDTVTAARFATFMLKQMGYTVADYKESVTKLAETKGSKVDANITGDLTRDDAVGVMYGALTAEKAQGKTVIADIVGDNADLKAKAEKLGLIAAPVTTEVAVQSVKALNCKQIEIVFNQEMNRDSVESESFYEIYDNGSSVAVELSDNSASLGDDGKTVIITLNKNVTDKLTNSSEAKVNAKKDIKAKSGAKLEKDAVFEKVAVEDGIFPTVTKVGATGEKHIRITFSEPVYDKDNDNSIAVANFKVVSGAYEYFVEKATLDNNDINLVLGTKLIEGHITVTFNNDGADKAYSIVDYAGYAVFKGTHEFDYVKDTSVSVVTVKSAIPNRVVLGFSKPVKATNIRLYHSVKNAANYVAIATTTDYVDEITFTYGKDSKLPNGTVKLFLVNSDENDAYKLVDAYGIKVPDQTLTYEVVIDETPPKFESGDFDRNVSITLTFDEELDLEVAKDTDNYEIKNLKNNTVTSFLIKIDDSRSESRKRVILLPNPKLKDNTEYQVIIKKAQDITGNETTKYYTYTFTTGDNTAPEVINDPKIYPRCFAIAEEGKIYIVYSEPMNKSQMLDKNNYMVSIINGDKNNYKSLGDHDSITKVDDSTVIIYFKELDNKNDPTIRPYVKIAPIMDLAGKRLGDSVDSYVVENIGADPVVVTVKSAKENKVVLGFSRPIKGSNIRLYHTDRNVGSYNAIATTTDYSDEIIFKFSEALPSGKITLYLENSEVTTKKLVDRYGVYVSDQSLRCEVEKISEPTPAPTSRTETDTTPPLVIDCTVNSNESITISFSERLERATATDPASYVVKRRSDNQEISFTPELDASRKSVKLIFDSKLEGSTEYQLLIKKYKDTSGNTNTSIHEYNFTTSESIPPEVINDPEDDYDCFVVVEKGKIFITYSEAMNETQMLDKGNYQVSLDLGLNYIALGDDDSITKVDDRRVLIYVKDLEGTDFIPYVKIEPIEDLAGNKLYDSDEPYIIENIEPENIHVEEAQLIAKNKIKLVFNKKMGSFNMGDFEILSTTPGEISFTACESNTVNSDGKTEVVLILNKDLTTDAKDNEGEWVSITTASNPSSESEWGSKLEPDSYFGLLDDKVTPEIIMWDHDNDESTPEVAKVIASGDIANPQYYGEDYSIPSGFSGIITIFFSEAIDVSTLTVDTFDVDGFIVDDITAHYEAKTVVLEVTVHTDHTSAKTTVTQVSEIYDGNGNAFAPGSTWTVTLSNNHLTN